MLDAVHTCELLRAAAVVDVGGVEVLLDALPLALWRALRDGLGEEGDELGDGAALVERERGEIGCAAQNRCGFVWGRENNSKGEYLHGRTLARRGCKRGECEGEEAGCQLRSWS